MSAPWVLGPKHVSNPALKGLTNLIHDLFLHPATKATKATTKATKRTRKPTASGFLVTTPLYSPLVTAPPSYHAPSLPCPLGTAPLSYHPLVTMPLSYRAP